MDLKDLKLFIFLPFLLSHCLKANRAPFDLSKPSSPGASSAGILISAGLNLTNTSSTNTTSSSSTAPSSISYGTTSTFKLIPGVSVNYTPTITGAAESWSITPSLPDGLSFNSTTGAITGTPNTSYLVTGFPLTTFTITAKNGTATKDFLLDMQVLKTGENVWTVINGVSGGNTNAGINSMKYDSNCNCLIIGGSTNVNLDGQTIPSTGGNASGFLSKYSLNGDRIWTTLIGVSGAAGTEINGVVLDSIGNIYIAGYHGPGNFKGCTTTSSYAGYVAKFNSDGVFQWATCTGTAQRHYYSGVLIDNNGDIVASGTTYDNGIDGMNHSSTTDQAGIIQKFNPSTGARISGVIIPGSSARGTDVYGVASDSSGKIYLAVATRSSSYCGDGTTNWRPALFRYNANMGYLGCTGIAVTATTYAFGVTAASNGDSYISGYTQSPGTTIDGIAAIGNEDGYVVKFDSNGVKQWTRRLGLSGKQTTITSVQFENTINALYVSGKTNGSLGGKTIQGTEDMFIAKYDTSGNQPDSNYWTNLQGINSSSSCSGGGCKASIAFDSNRTMYSFTDTTGAASGVTNPATPNRSLFLVRNVQ